MLPSDPPYKILLKKMAYRLGKLHPIKPQDISEGTELCRMLQGHDLFTTLAKLSKAGDDPEEVVRDYRVASNSLLSGRDRFYLSLKLPALDFDIKHAAAIAATALINGHGVHFDSHKFAQTDPTRPCSC